MRQPINFHNLRIGKIVPCDVDVCCKVNIDVEESRRFVTEYHNTVWFFAEIKLQGTAFPTGQRLVHERLVNDLVKTGKPALSVLAVHTVKDPAQEIDAAECIVKEYFWHRKWHECTEARTLKDVLFSFIRRYANPLLLK